MSTRAILSWSSPCLVALFFVGCAGTSSTPQAANQSDPIQQEIEKKVQSKPAPQAIPPGHTMNSGGEIVPVGEKTDTDDQ